MNHRWVMIPTLVQVSLTACMEAGATSCGGRLRLKKALYNIKHYTHLNQNKTFVITLQKIVLTFSC